MIQAYEAQAVGGSTMQGGVAVLRCALPPAIRSDILVSGWIQDFTGLVITPSMQGGTYLRALNLGMNRTVIALGIQQYSCLP